MNNLMVRFYVEIQTFFAEAANLSRVANAKIALSGDNSTKNCNLVQMRGLEPPRPEGH